MVCALVAAADPPVAGPLEAEDFSNDTVVTVSDHGTVRLHASDVPLSTVLHLLSLQSQRNIIATPGVRGSVTAHLFDVSLEEALDAILLSNNAGYREHGSFIYIYTNEELANLIAGETPPTTRVFRLNYITASDARTIVLPLLGPDGSITVSPDAEVGIASSAEEAGGNSLATHDLLVVHDRPDRIAKIAGVIKEIDIRPRQVLIEATIMRAQLSEDNALGVDFTLLGGVDLELLDSESTAITDLTVGDLPQERFGNFNSTLTTDFTGAVPPGGATLGIIKDHVAVFVRALEAIADTTVIANPKVLAVNKQRGEVIVGRQDGYPVILTTETTSQQTSQMLDTGTRLIFRPFIGDDGYVRMELHPEDSRGEVVGGQPQKETTEITTNVIIKDGQTILIGGLFRESTRDSRGQIPLLGDIPVVGAVFQSRRDTTEREEVIILLTVHIIKEDAYAEAGREQLEEIERMRVGVRRGIQWHGRERIAQAHYRKALDHFAMGEDEKALWDVKMALHNNPRFNSALHLKERITGRRDWDDDGSFSRDFVQLLIAAEHGNGRPFYERPGPPFERPENLAGPNGFEDTPQDKD